MLVDRGAGPFGRFNARSDGSGEPHQPLDVAHALNEGGLLWLCAVKERGHHPPRDHERMAARHGKRVEDGKTEGVCAVPLALGDPQERGGGFL